MLPPITGDPTYDTVLLAGIALAVVTAIASAFVTTPYGRFESKALGPTVPQRVGWLLLEVPALIVFPIIYMQGPDATAPVPLLFAALWFLHYANRALYFPLAMRVRPGARMGLLVPGSGWFVVPMHAYLFARWYSELGHLTLDWLTTPWFLVGLPTYLFGFALTVHSEHLLRTLRKPGETAYKIPHGGGFRYVSSPHYLGELIAFTGLGLATACPGGLFIVAISAANLVPRALRTHAWYQRTFPDYPGDRHALVPWFL